MNNYFSKEGINWKDQIIEDKGYLELEGELMTLIENDEDGIHICAEVCGIDIWKWLEKSNGERIKIKIERYPYKNNQHPRIKPDRGGELKPCVAGNKLDNGSLADIKNY